MVEMSLRVDEATHAVVRELARLEGRSMRAMLAAAVEDYRRRKLLDSINAAHAELRHDAAAWKEELTERAAWEGVVADGLPGLDAWPLRASRRARPPRTTKR